jgi:hypothetical protein
LQDLSDQIPALNIVSGKENCIAQLKQWVEIMHTKINQKYKELQLELDRIHRQIEENTDRWKKSFADRIKTKVGYVLMEQLEKCETDGASFDQVQDEFIRLKELFNVFNSQPLISIFNLTDNQANWNDPYVVFPAVLVDAFNWLEDSSMENPVETIEYFLQQQIDLDACTTTRSTGNYAPEL